jgi:hypothetical protein
VWLEQRERGGRREEGGDRQVVQGPVGCREDLGFEPEGGGSHGGLWAGEGGPGSWAPPGGCCGTLAVMGPGERCWNQSSVGRRWGEAGGFWKNPEVQAQRSG